MMDLYFVKSDLPGLPAGRVERFSVVKAAIWLREGAIEPFDVKKHSSAPGAPRLAPQPAIQAKPLK